MSNAEVVDETDIIFTIEGGEQHLSAHISTQTKVQEFALAAAKAGAVNETLVVFLENADEPLGGELVLIEHLPESFAPLHVGRHHHIATTVRYGTREVERGFRPSATITKVIEWAIGPETLKLEGAASDFDLKHGGKIVPPDLHLGQVARGDKAICFELVFKEKPQG